MNINSLEHYIFYTRSNYSFSYMKKKYNRLSKECLNIINNYHLYSKEGKNIFTTIWEFIKKIGAMISNAIKSVVNWLKKFLRMGSPKLNSLDMIQASDPDFKVTLPKDYVNNYIDIKEVVSDALNISQDLMRRGGYTTNKTKNLVEGVRCTWTEDDLNNYIAKRVDENFFHELEEDAKAFNKWCQDFYETMDRKLKPIDFSEKVTIPISQLSGIQTVFPPNSAYIRSSIADIHNTLEYIEKFQLNPELEKARKLEMLHEKYPELDEGFLLMINFSKAFILHTQYVSDKLTKYAMAACEASKELDKCIQAAINSYNEYYKTKDR